MLPDPFQLQIRHGTGGYAWREWFAIRPGGPPSGHTPPAGGFQPAWIGPDLGSFAAGGQHAIHGQG
jgi:hypothetical protein